jgi:hypothetical protein
MLALARVDDHADHLQRMQQGLHRILADGPSLIFSLRPIDLEAANPRVLVLLRRENADRDFHNPSVGLQRENARGYDGHDVACELARDQA